MRLYVPQKLDYSQSQRFWKQIFVMDKRALEEKLREACCLGDFESAIKLLDNGVDINSRNSLNGWTALHWACKNSQASMVSLLLSRGSDISIRTITGQTPRDLTTSLEVATLLQSCESPPVSPNSRSPITDRLPYDPPHNMLGLNRHDSLMSQHCLQDTVIKIRIANSTDTDFIEVELSRHVTYQNLLSVCCQELAVPPEQVTRIRKLPDTRIRSDADVRRLRPLQELEVVLKDAVVSAPPQMPTNNIYPSISSNKNQTVLY